MVKGGIYSALNQKGSIIMHLPNTGHLKKNHNNPKDRLQQKPDGQVFGCKWQVWVVTRQRKLLSPLVFLKGYKFLMK
jgi:hypothetical protein